MKIKLINRILNYLVKKEIKQRNYAIGLNSTIDVDKDKHMLFLDYDTNNLSDVLSDVKELVEFWNLSDFEIFSTIRGNHVFFWYDNNLPYSRVKMILNFSRCDNLFKYIKRYYNHSTIRASGKYRNGYSDLRYIGKFTGKRKHTKEEHELGELKRKEYLLLKDIKIFKNEVLKC